MNLNQATNVSHLILVEYSSLNGWLPGSNLVD